MKITTLLVVGLFVLLNSVWIIFMHQKVEGLEEEAGNSQKLLLQAERENSRKLLEQKNQRLAELETLLLAQQQNKTLLADNYNRLLKEEKERVENGEKRIRDLEKEQNKTKLLLEKKKKGVGVLERRLKEAQKQPNVDRVGIKPLRIAVTHLPHNDRLGSFCEGAIKLLAVAYRWGWDFEVLPYEGSGGMNYLKKVFSGLTKFGDMQHAATTNDYDPVELNRRAYDTLGFFPTQTHPVPNATWPPKNSSKWIDVAIDYDLPGPGDPALLKLCAQKPLDEGNGYVRCRIIFPYMRESNVLVPHMEKHGGIDAFFNPEFRKLMRDGFLQNNAHRIKFFKNDTFNVAMHVRRGDVNPEKYKERYVSQSTFASLARYLCQKHPGAHLHIFSGGKNTDGNWDVLEQVTDTCVSVSFHIDQHEFDTWAHFVAADVLVTSKSSTFATVPAYMNAGEVYCTERYTTSLGHWKVWTHKGLYDKKTRTWWKPPKAN